MSYCPVPGAVNVAPSLCYAPALYGTVDTPPTIYGYMLGPPSGALSVAPGATVNHLPASPPVRAPSPPGPAPLSQGMGTGTVIIGVAAVAALAGLAYWSFKQRRGHATTSRKRVK